MEMNPANKHPQKAARLKQVIGFATGSILLRMWHRFHATVGEMYLRQF
jgi:hypothetical protein